MAIEAARRGDLEMLRYLRPAKRATANYAICAAAAGAGRLQTLEWLHTEGYRWDYTTCRNAARHRHLDVLRYARANWCPWEHEWQSIKPFKFSTAYAAAAGGNVELLIWARGNGCVMSNADSRFVDCAAYHGRLAALQWFRQLGHPWNSGTCVAAARGGQAETLRWLIDNGCPCPAHLL